MVWQTAEAGRESLIISEKALYSFQLDKSYLSEALIPYWPLHSLAPCTHTYFHSLYSKTVFLGDHTNMHHSQAYSSWLHKIFRSLPQPSGIFPTFQQIPLLNALHSIPYLPKLREKKQYTKKLEKNKKRA